MRVTDITRNDSRIIRQTIFRYVEFELTKKTMNGCIMEDLLSSFKQKVSKQLSRDIVCNTKPPRPLKINILSRNILFEHPNYTFVLF